MKYKICPIQVQKDGQWKWKAAFIRSPTPVPNGLKIYEHTELPRYFDENQAAIEYTKQWLQKKGKPVQSLIL